MDFLLEKSSVHPGPMMLACFISTIPYHVTPDPSHYITYKYLSLQSLSLKLLETVGGRRGAGSGWEECAGWTNREGAGGVTGFLFRETVWVRLRKRKIGPGRLSCPHLISILIHPTSLQVTISSYQTDNILHTWVVPSHMMLPGIPFLPLYLVSTVNPSCIP